MEGKHEKGHATLETYRNIIIALALITVAEIVVPYIVSHDVNSVIGIALLVILAIVKYVLVVAFFMHLYYDQPLCTFLFVTGMVLGGGTMAGLLSAMPHNAYNPAATSGTGQDTGTDGGPKLPPGIEGNAEAMAGMKLFEANCVTCHHLSALPTATGVIGPDLDGIWERGATRVKGETAEQYIDHSIKDPGAFVVDGYPNSMTNFGYDDAKRKELVAFLMIASKPAPADGGGAKEGASPAPGGASPGEPPATPAPGSGASPTTDAVQEAEASPNAGSSPGGAISPSPVDSTEPAASPSP